MTHTWNLKNPIDAVIFDCDGTLSSIEGIDELAKTPDLKEKIKKMTEKAMAESGLTREIYQKRLAMIKPTHDDMGKLGKKYVLHVVPDIAAVIGIFKNLKKEIFLVSAGITQAVIFLGDHLNIPRKNINAVDLIFDERGHYIDFDRKSVLSEGNGKKQVVEHIKNQYRNLAFVGDGLNDLAAQPLVNRFIGYGGSFYRENIAKACEFYLLTSSMAPLLPLLLTQKEVQQLDSCEKNLYDKGLREIENNQVKIQLSDATWKNQK